MTLQRRSYFAVLNHLQHELIRLQMVTNYHYRPASVDSTLSTTSVSRSVALRFSH